MDFAIALLLFTFTVAVYFSYTNNFQKDEHGDLNSIISDAKAISSSLTLSGYPSNWDNTTVIRIGIADEQRINATKLKNFKNLNYSQTKKKFGTAYDYFVFFTNNNGDVLNLRGICGVGSQNILASYNIKSAYYYQDPSDSFLKNFMNQTFYADIYFKDTANDIYGLYGLISNLSKYGFVVMEHPLISPSNFDNYQDKLENFTSNWGYLMISGELVGSKNGDLVGATFIKKQGQSSAQRTAIVNNTDQYLSLTIGQSMTFNQYYYVENNTASPSPTADFTVIAIYNQTDDNAIARWQYGNGTVYFFSDFDVSNFNGNFVNIVEDVAKSLIQGTCKPINITSIPKQKLVKTERYLNYNSQVVKMVVYVWQ